MAHSRSLTSRVGSPAKCTGFSTFSLIALRLVQTDQGNWVARAVGLDQAPTTTDDSASAIVKVVSSR